MWERVAVLGAPFELGIHAKASESVAASVTKEVIDVSGIEPGDYKIAREVFEEVQRLWGECTLDAFASVATTTLPRFWTSTPKPGTEGTDAFKQDWARPERIWAHPPFELLDDLSFFLDRSERQAEVIVCVPYRPTAPWFFRLAKLADTKKKYMAGKLAKVAKDAPARVHEWPIVVMHIPSRAPSTNAQRS